MSTHSSPGQESPVFDTHHRWSTWGTLLILSIIQCNSDSCHEHTDAHPTPTHPNSLTSCLRLLISCASDRLLCPPPLSLSCCCFFSICESHHSWKRGVNDCFIALRTRMISSSFGPSPIFAFWMVSRTTVQCDWSLAPLAEAGLGLTGGSLTEVFVLAVVFWRRCWSLDVEVHCADGDDDVSCIYR